MKAFDCRNMEISNKYWQRKTLDSCLHLKHKRPRVKLYSIFGLNLSIHLHPTNKQIPANYYPNVPFCVVLSTGWILGWKGPGKLHNLHSFGFATKMCANEQMTRLSHCCKLESTTRNHLTDSDLYVKLKRAWNMLCNITEGFALCFATRFMKLAICCSENLIHIFNNR